jgi:hypothetical protein
MWPMMDDLLSPHTLEELALTSDQQTNYDALAADFKNDAAKWRADNNYDPEKAREDMGRARDAGDKAMIQKLIEQRKGFMDLRQSYIEKLRALLTDEQNVTLDKALKRVRNSSGALPPPQPPPADK